RRALIRTRSSRPSTTREPSSVRTGSPGRFSGGPGRCGTALFSPGLRPELLQVVHGVTGKCRGQPLHLLAALATEAVPGRSKALVQRTVRPGSAHVPLRMTMSMYSGSVTSPSVYTYTWRARLPRPFAPPFLRETLSPPRALAIRALPSPSVRRRPPGPRPAPPSPECAAAVGRPGPPTPSAPPRRTRRGRTTSGPPPPSVPS